MITKVFLMKNAEITWSTTPNVLQRVGKTMVHQKTCHDKIAEEQKAININESEQLSLWSTHRVTYRKKEMNGANVRKKRMQEDNLLSFQAQEE